MAGNITDRAMAMAGIIQACHCVQQIARNGMTDSDALTGSIKSLFTFDAASTAGVYAGGSGVLTGLRYGSKLFDNKHDASMVEVMRYCIGIMQLERKLIKHKELLTMLRVGIEKAQIQSEQYSITHVNVLANLAGTYADTVSRLSPQIMVNGEEMHLGNSENVNRIRSLLLAAIRSAVLWRQKGGSRLQILFSRNSYLSEFNRLISDLN